MSATAANPDLPGTPEEDPVGCAERTFEVATEGGFRLGRDAGGYPVIESAEQAEWALRKLHRLSAAEQRVEELNQAELARIGAWHDGEVRRIENDRAFFEGLLIAWHRAQLAADGPASIRLPHGTLKATRQQPEWVYDDIEAFLAWATNDHPELVRVKIEPDRALVKSAAVLPAEIDQSQPGDDVIPIHRPSGEEIPGVRVVCRPRKFTVVLTEATPIDTEVS